MCGRYAASRSADQLVEEFEVDRGPEQDLAPDYNVAPTKAVFAVLERSSGDEPVTRRLSIVRWGLVPSWAKDPSGGGRMANARLETAAEKPSFRRAWARRRCLIPADGYFEWQAVDDGPRGRSGKPLKQPWFIHPRDGGVLAMAGLYEWWRDPTRDESDPAAWLCSVAVVTTDSHGDLARIHDRMPLLVPRAERDAWLDPEESDPSGAVARMLPVMEGMVTAHPVSTSVNSVRNNGPELLEPVEAIGS